MINTRNTPVNLGAHPFIYSQHFPTFPNIPSPLAVFLPASPKRHITIDSIIDINRLHSRRYIVLDIQIDATEGIRHKMVTAARARSGSAISGSLSAEMLRKQSNDRFNFLHIRTRRSSRTIRYRGTRRFPLWWFFVVMDVGDSSRCCIKVPTSVAGLVVMGCSWIVCDLTSEDEAASSADQATTLVGTSAIPSPPPPPPPARRRW